ncbi:MAG: restriction endonuclease [Leptospiraceae bacterium]|nr:restriction endonuclease [Leptospiraceae bacterium]
MKKIIEAQEILKSLGLPDSQQNEMSALTLLALLDLHPRKEWSQSTRKSVTITKGIMDFVSKYYKKKYAPNTRETFRRQVLHQFVQAGIADYNPDNPNLPTNSPKAHYAISELALSTIVNYKTNFWEKSIKNFKAKLGSLKENYERNRKLNLVPVKLPNGEVLELSPGNHNIVQAAIVEKFGGYFVKNGFLLYIGDTVNKDLYIQKKYLEKLNIHINDHDKLPDVILFDPIKNRLFLIEAVTSHGPMTPKRINELEIVLKNTNAIKVYVSAFPDFTEFKKHINSIAWETEIWIAEHPEHMIHFNGDKFLD